MILLDVGTYMPNTSEYNWNQHESTKFGTIGENELTREMISLYFQVCMPVLIRKESFSETRQIERERGAQIELELQTINEITSNLPALALLEWYSILCIDA